MINSINRSLVSGKKWYRNISAGNPLYSEMELISTTLITSNTASVTFSSIPTTYKHLQLRATILGTAGFGSGYTFNGDNGANYSMHRLSPDSGLNLHSAASTSTTVIQSSGFANGFVSGQPSAIIVDVLDYLSNTNYKTAKHLFGQASSGGNELVFGSGSWRSTSAISSMTFLSGNNMLTGSRFSLYGIKG